MIEYIGSRVLLYVFVEEKWNIVHLPRVGGQKHGFLFASQCITVVG